MSLPLVSLNVMMLSAAIKSLFRTYSSYSSNLPVLNRE